MSRAAAISATILIITGCRPTPEPNVVPPTSADAQPAGAQEATFYVAGMNARLKIL